MLRKITVILAGFFIGLYFGFVIKTGKPFILNPIAEDKNQVIGFLPYWLIDKADKDYTKYINTLTYFGLTISPDGTIMKETNPGESEPGWLALNSGKVNPFMETAKKNNMQKSLLIFSGNEENIYQLLNDPLVHAQNLMKEVSPIMKNNGFRDLNLDIESVITASDEARTNFTTFVKTVKQELDKENLGTLTIDISPIALFKKYLIDLNSISNTVDYVVLMTYDFHYQGSSVTGAIGPVGGAGNNEEFDTEVSVKEATRIIPPGKILLGIPLYGYEWETIDNTPHNGVIPGTGVIASNRRMEEQIKSCTNCTVTFDDAAKESLIIYKDDKTGLYHQIYFPDEKSVNEKVKLANKYELAGIALWALGYEGNSILNPLTSYK